MRGSSSSISQLVRCLWFLGLWFSLSTVYFACLWTLNIVVDVFSSLHLIYKQGKHILYSSLLIKLSSNSRKKSQNVMLWRNEKTERGRAHTWVRPLHLPLHHEAQFWWTGLGVQQPGAEAFQCTPEVAHQLPWWLPARVLLTSRTGKDHKVDCNPGAVPGIEKQNKWDGIWESWHTIPDLTRKIMFGEIRQK